MRIENCIPLEKGVVGNDKYWVPKYIADSQDAKVLWLWVSSDNNASGYSYTSRAAKEQYAR